jgi:hypothetical protein
MTRNTLLSTLIAAAAVTLAFTSGAEAQTGNDPAQSFIAQLSSPPAPMAPSAVPTQKHDTAQLFVSRLENVPWATKAHDTRPTTDASQGFIAQLATTR